MWGTLLAGILLAWGCLINPILRHRRFKYMQSLDPVKDAWTILNCIQHVEFPLIHAKALEFALFRTYAIPSISKILVGTGEFKRDCARRYAGGSIPVKPNLLIASLVAKYDSISC
ncbi:hypothetical protein WJX72_011620 [[Myrmecia] bisecta]|uniref:Cytochrome P450 n=1 Tax=[Myrmecia] bisecta TaxID=41462 RepID=A0AAW1QTJ5_9CHLO